MKRLITHKELTLATRRQLFILMTDSYESYTLGNRIILRNNETELSTSFRDNYGKITYVLLNSVEFNVPMYLYTEFDFEESLISDFKDMDVNEQDYIEVVEKLRKHYQGMYDTIQSRDRRIKKSDSEDQRVELEVTRKVMKRQEKKLEAIDEYLKVLRNKLK